MKASFKKEKKRRKETKGERTTQKKGSGQKGLTHLRGQVR